MSDDSILFSPVTVGSLRLGHRVVMAPMTRNRAGAGNTPTELMASYYAQRASAALIISEATQVTPAGLGYPNTPGIHSPAQVDGWRRVTDAVHSQGGHIFLQLWHVGRISHPSLQPDGALPVAPSAIAAEGNALTFEGPKPFVVPRALETAEVPGIVEQFAVGARHAREAGFDGVEVHAANGYLIEQFLLDGTNRRTDVYGGSPENRARFLLEVTRAVIGAWSADRVGVRLSPRSRFNSMSDSDRPLIFGHAVRQLNELGLAYLHLVDPITGSTSPDAEARLAPALRPAFSGPVIINGGFDRDAAEKALERGEADLVSFGVPFLANPDLPARLRRATALNSPERATFYGGDSRGYTDYPAQYPAETELGSPGT